MESVAYMISRNFILLAVDTNFETSFKGVDFKMSNAKKLHILNDKTAISVIGNPYKISDIYKYVLNLKSIDENSGFNKIVEDVKDVFNSSGIELKKGIEEISKLLPKYKTDSGHVDTATLFEFLKDKPELISILKDSILSVNNEMPMLSQLLIVGWQPELDATRLSHNVSIGLNLTGSDFDDFKKGLVYTRFASATVHPTETTKLETELSQELTPILCSGWEDDKAKVESVIDLGKIILSKGLERITPYKSKPNIVFYELSPMTNYKFKEPDLKLVKIQYNRN